MVVVIMIRQEPNAPQRYGRIKRQVTIKNDDPVDELDDLFDEMGISKTKSVPVK